MTIESFQSSLARGQDGEAKFASRFPSLIKTDGRRFDFQTVGGKSVEVKSDFYDVDKTANFFLEVVSIAGANKIGGPFQSLGNGVDYFCYYFVKSDQLFIFKTSEICCRILELLPKYQLTKVINQGYSTYGVRIERSKFKDLQLSEAVLSV